MGHSTSLPLQFPLWLWDALAAREASMRGLDLNSMTHYITLVGGFFWKFLVHTSLFCGHSLVSARTFGRDRKFGYFTTLRSGLPDLPAMLGKKKKINSSKKIHKRFLSPSCSRSSLICCFLTVSQSVAQSVFNASQGVRDIGFLSWTPLTIFPPQVSCIKEGYIA